MSPPRIGLAALLRLGLVGGAAMGAAAGLAECALAPLAEPLRIPFTVGADGLLGAAWGLLATLPLAARGRLRAAGLPPVAGALGAVVLFPALAAALGLFANRVLLRGTHFLSPLSLGLDVVALVVAAGLAAVLGRALRGALAARGARRAPGPVGTVLVLAVLLAAWRLPPRAVERGAPDPALPDIVLISIDTLRPDRLSGGGHPAGTSPEIDRLVAEGALWPEAVTASPGSAASHAALLTSRYPVSNGVWSNFTVMDESVTTLAEILRARGYRTGGFVTNTFLGRRFGFDQGFGTYVESGVVERLEEPSRAALTRSLAAVQIVDRVRGRLQPGADPSFATALAWRRESDRPTFWFVHLMDVHSPYVPPHPYGPRFGADPSGGAPRPRHRNRFGWAPSENAYLGEIRFADAKIGRLRRLLETLGALDRSVVVLTTDHGENLLDHEPRFSHGRTLFDATLRVLAAVRMPDRIAPRTLDPGVFENVDVLPTLAALLGTEPFAEWEGRAFPPGTPRGREVTISQLDRDFAVRTRDAKIVLKATGEREYYDLALDPAESATAPAPEGSIAEAEAILAAWLDRTATELWTERARSVGTDELSPEIVEKLRTLGYVD